MFNKWIVPTVAVAVVTVPSAIVINVMSRAAVNVAAADPAKPVATLAAMAAGVCGGTFAASHIMKHFRTARQAAA